jgi:hypothetical protein
MQTHQRRTAAAGSGRNANSPSVTNGPGGTVTTRGSPFSNAAGSGRLDLGGLANLPGMYQVRTPPAFARIRLEIML